ncbi:MAG: hypothetical protein A2049_06505 [Elusimicrobia bacterium GWA2_62_23]|nr:MAG: hypothetical protein A2049_06505 [Elusimicrobia bacterium GWA2_62_23]OGR71632.1 MAG: hypothetical protein A2179_06985 [Elusimicrobia bacterium GWC2_63_65]
MENTDMENKFNEACAGMELKDCRDLRPGVMAAIRGGAAARTYRRPLWAAGFAAAAVVLMLAIPGATQSIVNGIKRLFSSEYAVKIGDQPEVGGTLISADGELKEIKAGDMLLQVRVTSLDEKMAKVQLILSYERSGPGGVERKIFSKPTIVAMKGKQFEMMVSNNLGVPVYKFRMTPVEKGAAEYSGRLVPLSSGGQ